jgi:hypothetical protein
VNPRRPSKPPGCRSSALDEKRLRVIGLAQPPAPPKAALGWPEYGEAPGDGGFFAANFSRGRVGWMRRRLLPALLIPAFALSIALLPRSAAQPPSAQVSATCEVERWDVKTLLTRRSAR